MTGNVAVTLDTTAHLLRVTVAFGNLIGTTTAAHIHCCTNAPGESDKDVLAYAEAMTLQVQMAQTLFDAVRRHFSERELVDLTATVASDNMVSRSLEALQIQIEAP